uniref:Gustatory receptor for sugar taste 64f n=1 Tax=Cacopsylla melanoneura TaxID=428564 RepID=A0A8D8QIU6_9HEMI
MVELMFFVNSLLIYSLFIQLSTKWTFLMKAWQKVEWDMRAYGYPPDFAKRCIWITSVIMLLAIVEHVFFIITRIAEAALCADKISLLEAYFLNVYIQIFYVVPYSLPLAIILAMFNFILTCAWNFMDLLIIILSHALAIRFQQVNQRLLSLKGKVLPSTVWRHLRETYNELSYLTKLVDQILSPIVLLSFANNLYFISLQLFNSLKPMHSVWEAIYFVYSFAYLLLRICAVSLYAASINDASKECTGVLFSIPSESYCVEVSRYLNYT